MTTPPLPRPWGPRDWQQCGSTALVALILAFCPSIRTAGWVGWVGFNLPVAILLLPGLLLVAWSIFEEPSVHVDLRLLIFYPYVTLAFTRLAIEDSSTVVAWTLFVLPIISTGAYLYLRIHSDRLRWFLFGFGILFLSALGDPFGFWMEG
jgi:hypothetical protein